MTQEFIEKLKGIIPQREIKLEEPLSNHTTFRIGGPAEVYVKPSTEQLRQLFALAKETDTPVTIIGNGSNLLVSDQGIRGVVAEIGSGMNEVVVGKTMVVAQAGALLSKVAHEAAEAGLGGFEFAAGIPGTVGGAVVMNAGAYGGEIKDVLKSVTVLSQEGEILTLTRDELQLSYRYSCIPEKKYIVLSATFALQEGAKEDIRATMENLRAQRIEKQPLEYPSAGSTFKRPEGYFAGKLIMDAGLRGYRVGGAAVSEKHCGFVINRGNATASDVKQLISDVQRVVSEKFGVHLETEVKMIGE